jgi:uncharacterized protein YaiI (UPF0178 family)
MTATSLGGDCTLRTIFVDADACPVKSEIYKVAKRYGWSVTVVANTVMHTPQADWLSMIVVGNNADAADNWIAEHVGEGDIVVTADIPLAARCLQNHAKVLDSRGKEFTEDAIGSALANRELLDQLRVDGMITGGPAPFQPKHRSNFLQKLDQLIHQVQKQHKL